MKDIVNFDSMTHHVHGLCVGTPIQQQLSSVHVAIGGSPMQGSGSDLCRHVTDEPQIQMEKKKKRVVKLN